MLKLKRYSSEASILDRRKKEENKKIKEKSEDNFIPPIPNDTKKSLKEDKKSKKEKEKKNKEDKKLKKESPKESQIDNFDNKVDEKEKKEKKEKKDKKVECKEKKEDKKKKEKEDKKKKEIEDKKKKEIEDKKKKDKKSKQISKGKGIESDQIDYGINYSENEDLRYSKMQELKKQKAQEKKSKKYSKKMHKPQSLESIDFTPQSTDFSYIKRCVYFATTNHDMVEYNYKENETIQNACSYLRFRLNAFRVYIICRGHILSNEVPIKSLKTSKEDPLVAVVEHNNDIQVGTVKSCTKTKVDASKLFGQKNLKRKSKPKRSYLLDSSDSDSDKDDDDDDDENESSSQSSNSSDDEKNSDDENDSN